MPREDERIALESIYGSDILSVDELYGAVLKFTFRLPVDTDATVLLEIWLDVDYPLDRQLSRQRYSIRNVEKEHFEWIDEEFKKEVDDVMCEVSEPGEPCIYQFVEQLREMLTEHYQVFSQTHPSLEHQSPSAVNTSERVVPVSSRMQVFSSENELVDRKSMFVAHVAAINDKDQVEQVMNQLLEVPRIAKATHNIMAYRYTTSDGILHQDYDDDGESAAGGRLMHMMQVCDCMNVVCVVSRWFGGVQLGADRFRHINQVARVLLKERGFIKK